MPKFRVNTIQKLLQEINGAGALQSKVAIYETHTGNEYEIVDVYTSDDDDEVLCFDIKRVD